MIVISQKLKLLSYLVAKGGIHPIEIRVRQVEGCYLPVFMNIGKSEKFIDSSTLTRKTSETCDMTEYYLSTEKSKKAQTNFKHIQVLLCRGLWDKRVKIH